MSQDDRFFQDSNVGDDDGDRTVFILDRRVIASEAGLAHQHPLSLRLISSKVCSLQYSRITQHLILLYILT